MIFLVLLLLAGISIIALWLYLFYETQDWTLPDRDRQPFQRVVSLFPHPDDESLSCAGTLADFSARGAKVYLAVLTKGERGVEGAQYTPSLKPIRTQEMEQSARALHAARLLQFDLGDNELIHQKSQVKHTIEKILDELKPDLVITYDESGLYGHPDHILVSELVTQLVDSRYPETALWYVSQPAKVYRHLKLPTHMAKDPEFIKKRQLPTFKQKISFPGLVAKIRSLASHQSQHFAFKKNWPWLPLWFMVSVQVYEYFYAAHRREAVFS